MIFTGLILIMMIHNIRNVQRQTETLRSLGRRYILDLITTMTRETTIRTKPGAM